MSLTSRLLRWSATPYGRRVLFAATTLIALGVACHPLLLPLLPVVDALGLDVLALLLGSQLVGAAPWLHSRLGPAARVGVRLLGGLLAGAAGGYLRTLISGLLRGTVPLGRAA